MPELCKPVWLVSPNIDICVTRINDIALLLLLLLCGPGSSVGIATELRAGRSGIESWWGRDFPLVQTGPGDHQASCKMGTESFPGVKCGRGVLLTTHPLLVLRSWKSRAIPLPTLWATPGLYGITLPFPLLILILLLLLLLLHRRFSSI